jgi:branched-chain amino acid transport system substrate-binding protein
LKSLKRRVPGEWVPNLSENWSERPNPVFPFQEPPDVENPSSEDTPSVQEASSDEGALSTDDADRGTSPARLPKAAQLIQQFLRGDPVELLDQEALEQFLRPDASAAEQATTDNPVAEPTAPEPAVGESPGDAGPPISEPPAIVGGRRKSGLILAALAAVAVVSAVGADQVFRPAPARDLALAAVPADPTPATAAPSAVPTPPTIVASADPAPPTVLPSADASTPPANPNPPTAALTPDPASPAAAPAVAANDGDGSSSDWSNRAAQLQLVHPTAATSLALAPDSPDVPEAASVEAANATSPPPTASLTPATSPSPTPALAPDSTVRGVTDKEVLFGMAAPFSGASRELGREMKIGVETAFNQINEAGGVGGRKLRLLAVDDGYEPTRTTDAMHELFDKDRVFGFVGNVGTPTAAVALPFALDHRALFFGAFTGANLLRRDPPDRYVYNYRASYAEETDAAVRYLVKVRRLQPSQIVVFAQQDAFGDSGYAGVAKAVRALPGDNPEIVRLNYKRNTVDVADAVNQLHAFKGKIKAVVMVASYRAAAKFIEKVHDFYPQMIYTNVSFVGSTALADELMLLGPQYAQGVIVTQVVPAISGYSSVVLKYKEALGASFPGEPPDYVSFEGYVDGMILGEALRRAGHDVDMEKLVDAFEQMRDYDLGLGATVTYGPNEHQGSHKIWGTQLDEAGHYQAIDLE